MSEQSFDTAYESDEPEDTAVDDVTRVQALAEARRAILQEVERRIVAPGELASLGRSSLLTKALRHLERTQD